MSKMKRYMKALQKADDPVKIAGICYDFHIHVNNLKERGYDEKQLELRQSEFYTLAITKNWAGFE